MRSVRHALLTGVRRLSAATAAGAVLITAPVTGADADDCDQACQIDWAWSAQRQNALPRTAFYDAPDPLPWAPSGTLIRAEATSEYVVRDKPVKAVRVLYHSRTSRGGDVAASGVVLVPQDRPRPAGGWKVVVDAHGASGIATGCAPSLMRDLYHGDQMVRFLEQGYAVVAPDYAGLGTTGRPELVNKTAEAEDIAGAVRSAHQAVPGLSGHWVLWGHSQGGGAALGFAERQLTRPVPGYRGTVVTSPAADLPALAAHVATTVPYGGFAPLLAQGAAYSDPKIDVTRLLTPVAQARLDSAGNGCLGVATAVYGDLTGPALTRPGYSSDPRFTRYLRDNSLGRQRVAGPVLFLQGGADTVTPQAINAKVAAELRRNGSHVTYRVYDGLEHDTYGAVTGIDDGAMDDILAWVRDRWRSGGCAASSHTSDGRRRSDQSPVRCG
ncbi:lipase [Sphaerisporangium melleum]|uniref:Lipase n=1 Tax=Sphaerisporangium melleum TaxID=321316 RepID=A0A917RN80_9ACTN|nr:lipase family protein [Sphaerisporangium melleum]GGL14724.1 lipase [Sphaerisporangium melleum]GII69384.1 lipase [Sphaerisporangium melleum]